VVVEVKFSASTQTYQLVPHIPMAPYGKPLLTVEIQL